MTVTRALIRQLPVPIQPPVHVHRISHPVRSMATRAPARLQSEQLSAALRHVPAWQKSAEKDSIRRTFIFADFNAAFGFMSRSALLAETLNHHPAWFNVYNRVEVELETHDCAGISNNDIEMATAMDAYAQQLGAQ